MGFGMLEKVFRALFKTPFERFDSMDNAMNHVSNIFEIPKRGWMETSALLQNAYFQRKISQFN